MCSLIWKSSFPGMPVHLVRALNRAKASAGRRQGRTRAVPRSVLPQVVAPEREWELLRAVERAARQYRRAQEALTHREGVGGGEGEFRHLLDAVILRHHELDRALLEIQRYYDADEAAEG